MYTVITTAILVLDLSCALVILFLERKNPTSTLAWLLVLIFLPFIGVIAYLMFGSGLHINKNRRYALKKVSDSLYKALIGSYINIHGGERRYAASNCTDSIIQYLENDGMCLNTEDNSVEMFTEGNSMFQRMLVDMEKAEKHIHLLYYIIRNDVLGKRIAALLTRKARQGVQVRVIYDSMGSMIAMDRMFKELRAAGGEVAAFSPFLFTLNFSSHLRLNYRNHRKITVVDGKIGYTGGMNIGDEYLGKHRRLTPWRDTQIRLLGSSVGFLQERFLMDWCFTVDKDFTAEEMSAFFPTAEKAGETAVQIASSGPDTPKLLIKSGMLKMIYSASKYIFIQTPYFTPDDSVLDGLRIAARAGVDVRLMLPAKPDHLWVQMATLSYARMAENAGVKVYLYNGFLHAKSIIIDGEAVTIGSSNMGERSFAMNFEINAFIYNQEFARKNGEIFLKDQKNCLQVTEDWFASRPALVRGAFGVSRLFAPLM